MNKIKTANTKVFLSLDLPEDKDKKEEPKKDDKKKDDSKKEEPKKEEPKKDEELKTATKEEKDALEKRKAEFMAKYVGQAATFQKAGMKFGFSTLSAKPANIQANLRRMIAAGLPEDAALASLTTTPAELLGLSDRLGSIDNGKIANLVISDKPYFNEKAKVRYVFVDGAMYPLEVKKENKDAKKDDASAKVDAAGDWTMTTETPQGSQEGRVSIVKDGSSLTGTISGGQFSQPVKLNEVKLDGSALSFSFSFDAGGTNVIVEVSVTIEGDTFKGTASVADFGSFPTEGKRIPK